MKASDLNRSWLILGGLAAAGMLVWQQASLWQLRTQLRHLRDTTPSAPVARSKDLQSPPATTGTPATGVARVAPVADPQLSRRVAALEDSVALLSQGADYLMDRGQIPPSPAKTAELRAAFLDPNRSMRDRLNALRLLRRNNLFSDDLAEAGAQWLVASTNAEVSRTLIESLRGVENASFKTALQNLAGTAATDRRLRETAISGLRDFTRDPQVETLLWQLASADSSAEIRRRAEETLRRVPMSEARASAVAARAVNSAATLDERLLSLRLLQESRQQLTQVAPLMAQASQMAADPESRIKYFQAFDDVNHPDFMLPLVQGLQDQNAAVRLRAADALIDYRSNPTIMQWLRVLAESDPDPRVRQEAARAFREENRRDGDTRR